MKFKVDDDGMHEEFHYPNNIKLTSSCSDPYWILNYLRNPLKEIAEPTL